MTKPFTFQRILSLSIEQDERQGYELIADLGLDGAMVGEDLISYLFFNDELTFYGSLIQHESEIVFVSSEQLLNIVENHHPYIDIKGTEEKDQLILENLKTAARVIREKNIWEFIFFEGNRPQLKNDTLVVAPPVKKIIEQTIDDKFKSLQLNGAQSEALLPHLIKFGWPKTSQTTMPIQVAIRLTEPEEGESEWMLETVITDLRGRHWTPAIRNRLATIEQAVPKKWKAHSHSIRNKQEEITSLINAIELSLDDTFIHTLVSDAEVRLFIQNDLPLLQSFQIPVILPAWLKSITESKMQLKTNISTQSYQQTTTLDEVLAFDWNFSLDGNDINEQSFRQLVDENREFIRSGDEWFHIDPEWLQKIKDIMERADAGEWTVKDLLFHDLPEEIIALDEDIEDDEVDPLLHYSMQQSLKEYMEIISLKKGMPTVAIPESLDAELREYQVDGFEWLVFMRENQFGACLADDMGLGKTIQLITYLLHIHNDLDVTTPSLIVCPTSVLGNWQKEIERFAPSLRVHTHYGPSRKKDEDFSELIAIQQPQVILTTYGTATQDGELLASIPFESITLDEAQNIKNMQTKQSRAIRQFKGKHHIALTGTPVENRLSELWAIFDFIHKGYFGSFKSFTDRFIIPIERDDSEKEKQTLRTKIRPFLLRRTKNDESLLLNLPKKVEQNEYCPLTPEQAALYESFLDETKFKLDKAEGFEKKGLVLTMLNRLKQLCNHPSLFLKEPLRPAKEMIGQSEKLRSILTMTANIVDNGEQCIIFTQYIGMGKLIQHCLTELYQIEAPFLTGSMPKNQRDELIQAFQNSEFPVFILSLRAGGTGLNLTAANHVLHADRWWNPAVENQATDRAYRIGQSKFVHVHKFVTIGTIEEKIDKMLLEKASLSADLIHSNQWITEISDEELDDLLTFDY